jgi:hypothetical protein
MQLRYVAHHQIPMIVGAQLIDMEVIKQILHLWGCGQFLGGLKSPMFQFQNGVPPPPPHVQFLFAQ